MFLKLYSGTGIAVTFLIFFTAVGLWTGSFINPVLPVYYTGVNTMPLYSLVRDFTGDHAFLGVLISFILVLSVSIILVYFNSTAFFISQRTFLPALFFIILCSALPEVQTLNPAIFASVFLLIALIRIIDSYRKNEIAYNFFDAAILISIGSLFYANLIWMGLIVFLGIALLRTVSITELLISVLGLITPYLLLYGIYYVLGKDLKLLNSLIISNLFGEAGDPYYTRIIIAALIMFGVNVLLAFSHLLTVFNAKKIKSRKTLSLLIWIFIVAAFSFVFLPSVSGEIVYIIAIPASYFITHYYVFMRKKLIPEIVFSIILALVVLVQIFYSR
jgi:hypothetical protein